MPIKLKIKNLKDKFLLESKLLMHRGKKVLLLFLILLLTVILILVNNQSNTGESDAEVVTETAQIDPSIVTFSTREPSEEKPRDEDYIVNPDEPRIIDLNTIGINGFIQKVGIDQDNKIAVPNNINIAGWFVDSVKPGEQGLSIIDGHVDGPTTGGIFYNLEKLKVNDVYSITYGDGVKYDFKVVEVITVPTEDSASILYSKRPEIKSQLNLITCTGNYVEDIESYDSRVIVISELV